MAWSARLAQSGQRDLQAQQAHRGREEEGVEQTVKDTIDARVLDAQDGQLDMQARYDQQDLVELLALVAEAEGEVLQVTLRLLAEHPEVTLPALAALQERLQAPTIRALLVRADRRDRTAILGRLERLEGQVPEAVLVGSVIPG